jgi:hypothetical protein
MLPHTGYVQQPVAYAPAPAYAAYAPAPAYSSPDEVRTVFVTGFPGDVKERELNNLLRFVHGCALHCPVLCCGTTSDKPEHAPSAARMQPRLAHADVRYQHGLADAGHLQRRQQR